MDAVEAAGFGKAPADGLVGKLDLDKAVADGFFLPQLNQSVLGMLKPGLLHPESEMTDRQTRVVPSNDHRNVEDRMAHSPFNC